MKLLFILVVFASAAVAGIPGGPLKNHLYWKHQPVWCDKDGITYYERASCNHEIAYPYAYRAPR